MNEIEINLNNVHESTRWILKRIKEKHELGLTLSYEETSWLISLLETHLNRN
ncbi:hypothetical protein [Peribacillus sp. SCS-155]|uniref:hypothetical protein n=1 Tax=Peribacillus sedimenti TaxID=3115297 RepID=UPI003905E185